MLATDIHVVHSSLDRNHSVTSTYSHFIRDPYPLGRPMTLVKHDEQGDNTVLQQAAIGLHDEVEDYTIIDTKAAAETNSSSFSSSSSSSFIDQLALPQHHLEGTSQLQSTTDSSHAESHNHIMQSHAPPPPIASTSSSSSSSAFSSTSDVNIEIIGEQQQHQQQQQQNQINNNFTHSPLPPSPATPASTINSATASAERQKLLDAVENEQLRHLFTSVDGK